MGDSIKKCIAEAVGTFTLVFIGCGTAVASGCAVNSSGYVATALAFGLVIVAMAYSVGKASGCHVNPAVTLATILDGRLSIAEAVYYFVGQAIGAILAGAILLGIFGRDSGLGTNGLYNGSIIASLLVEIILTAIFVYVILSVTAEEKYSNIAGIVIGLTLVLVHLMGIGLTGTSVNPIRSLGVAIFAGGDALINVWVFIVGPFIGSVISVVLYRLINK